jgi:hypothetical protein
MSTAQQADVATSLSIVNTLLALEAVHKRGVILVDPADLQALADEVKRLSKDDGECYA